MGGSKKLPKRDRGTGKDMRELSLHILDLVQNSLAAAATKVTIMVRELTGQNRLEIEIRDNGRGIPRSSLGKVHDPFYTTRSSRQVGLGLSLFEAAARQCSGTMTVECQPGQGTTVLAVFQYDHLDRAPLGNMADTILALIATNPGVDFCYIHQYDTEQYQFDTREIKEYLGCADLAAPAVIAALREYLTDRYQELRVPVSQALNNLSESLTNESYVLTKG